MLRLELHNDNADTRIVLGTVGEFIAEVVADMRDVQFTSKIFSTKGTIDRQQLDKEFAFALDRVLQRIRDNHV